MSIPAAASAASIPPSHESLDLLRACECPVDAEPLVHAVTLIPCCHKINQAVAEAMYGRMAGESCEKRGRPCVLCRAPIIAYYPDPVMRDVAHRALRLAELRGVAPRVDAIPPVVEPRVLPARRPAEARPDVEPRVVVPRVDVDVVPPRIVEEVRVAAEEVVERRAFLSAYYHQPKTPQFIQSKLLFAIDKGFRRVALNLIESGEDPNSIGDCASKPFFYSAIDKRDRELVLNMIRHGARVNYIKSEDYCAVSTLGSHQSNSPLIYSIEHGFFDMVELLINNGADVNQYNGHEQTPLIRAVECGHLPLVRLLLDRGASPTKWGHCVAASGIFGGTPISLAVHVNKHDIAELLIAAEAELGR